MATPDHCMKPIPTVPPLRPDDPYAAIRRRMARLLATGAIRAATRKPDVEPVIEAPANEPAPVKKAA